MSIGDPWQVEDKWRMGREYQIGKLWHRQFLKTQTAVVLEVKKDFFPSATPSAKVMFDLLQNFCE